MVEKTTMAEVFGLRVDVTSAGKAGPDLIIKHPQNAKKRWCRDRG